MNLFDFGPSMFGVGRGKKLGAFLTYFTSSRFRSLFRSFSASGLSDDRGKRAKAVKSCRRTNERTSNVSLFFFSRPTDRVESTQLKPCNKDTLFHYAVY